MTETRKTKGREEWRDCPDIPEEVEARARRQARLDAQAYLGRHTQYSIRNIEARHEVSTASLVLTVVYHRKKDPRDTLTMTTIYRLPFPHKPQPHDYKAEAECTLARMIDRVIARQELLAEAIADLEQTRQRLVGILPEYNAPILPVSHDYNLSIGLTEAYLKDRVRRPR